MPQRRLRALIVDDEAPAREELRHLLGRLPEVEVVGEAAQANEALELLQAIPYDMVFLDIRMPDGSGLDLARQLASLSHRPAVIFTTAYAEYAVPAFEVNATDYLLKPLDDAALRRAVERVMARRRDAEIADEMQPPTTREPSTTVQRLPITTPHQTLLMNPAAICYLEALEGTVRIVHENGETATRGTLREFQERLRCHAFFRANRRHLVNLDKVVGLIPNYRGGFQLLLSCPADQRLPVSRRQARKLRRLLDL